MGKPLCYDAGNAEVSQGLINKIYGDGIHFATPISSLRTNELHLVRSVLQILQGYSSSLFHWDQNANSFEAKSGIYVSHLSHTSLHAIINQFMYAATCLQLIEIVVNKVEKSARLPPPTLRAFACSVCSWLKRWRDIALEEEMRISKDDNGTTPTLLGLASSLASLCSGAESLLQIVHGAIPQVYFESDSSLSAAELTLHVLDYLYKKLDEVCLVRGGEDEDYQMLLHLFIGSILPYIEGLDSWLFEGTLDDPYEEMFFFANRAVSVDKADFWEKSYLLRQVRCQILDVGCTAPSCASDHASVINEKKGVHCPILCPLFIKDIAKSIVSAGKSLQLIRHIPMTSSGEGNYCGIDGFGSSNKGVHCGESIAGLTLSEVFCVSLAGLVGHGDHIFQYIASKQKVESDDVVIESVRSSEKAWCKFLVDTLLEKRLVETKSPYADGKAFCDGKEENMFAGLVNKCPLSRSFCQENPVTTVCQKILSKNGDAWKTLNLSRNLSLPPLNDEVLRKAIFGVERGSTSSAKGTNYTFGFRFGESEYLRSQDDSKMLQMLFPFPTLLPFFEVLVMDSL